MRIRILLLCLVAAVAYGDGTHHPLSGYTPQHSAAEAGWEEKFSAVPERGRIRENDRRLSAHSHHTGSPYDKNNAEWLLARHQTKDSRRAGAIGCIIYFDPRDEGFFNGDPFPEGPTRPAEGIQRGSVMDMPVYPGARRRRACARRLSRKSGNRQMGRLFGFPRCWKARGLC
jgi:hypothetical protein